jgi:hypothetical protein
MSRINRIGLLGWLGLLFVTIAHPAIDSWAALASIWVVAITSSAMLLHGK